MDGSFQPKLLGGIDTRCFLPSRPCFVRNLLSLGTNNCAWAMVCMQLLRLLGRDDKDLIREFLRRLLGADATFDFWEPTDEHPPFVVVQTPRNNLVLIYGTHTWQLLVDQIMQGINGPTRFGAIQSLPLWWNHSTRVITVMNLAGVDYSKPTFVVGHSFGAAVAYLVWYRLWNADPTRIVRVLTGGCPKPGDDVLARRIELFCIHTSYVSAGDIVPLIPPSNALRAGLQVAIPFLPNAWFTQWVPLHQYTHMNAGGVWEDGPFRDGTLAQYINFFRTDIFQPDGPTARQHEPRAYVRRMSLHCGLPEPPFDADCYNLLFETDAFSNGGPWLGGAGKLPFLAASGIVLGGLGAMADDDLAALELGGAGLGDDDLAAIELGGVGLGDDDLAALELGGAGLGDDDLAALQLGGEGILEPLGPGPTCDQALVGTLGVTYESSITGAGSEQWFKWPIENGVLYHVRMTFPAGTVGTEIWHGSSCGSKSSLGAGPDGITPCIEYTAGADEWFFLTVGAPIVGSADYTVIFDEGAC